MKRTNYYLILAIAVICLSCASSRIGKEKGDSLTATALQPIGRTVLTKEGGLELISSAVHFGASFEGISCQVYASLPNKNGHNYLQYELDGQYGKRIRVEGNATTPVVITAPHAGKHTIWIYKATEAHVGAIIIQKVTGNHIKALQIPIAPLIEFIGNSITCGAAADASEVPCGTGEYHDHHNAYYAYGPRVARALGANYIVSSVSGIGVYRNWNSDGPTMPQVYEKADFQDTNTQLWNFPTYKPQVVSIALGTNDFSGGDGKRKRDRFDSAAFVSKYISFVQLVKSKYPDATIALLSSPMVGGDNRMLLQNCLTAVKGKVDDLYPSGMRVALYFFQPMQPHGCSGHPSVEDHAILATELLPFFKQLITPQ